MSNSRTYKELRAKDDDLSSKHAELFFPQGHKGSAHCGCEMAQEVRRIQEEAEMYRKPRKTPAQCLLEELLAMIEEASQRMSAEEFAMAAEEANKIIDRVIARAGVSKERGAGLREGE